MAGIVQLALLLVHDPTQGDFFFFLPLLAVPLAPSWKDVTSRHVPAGLNAAASFGLLPYGPRLGLAATGWLRTRARA